MTRDESESNDFRRKPFGALIGSLPGLVRDLVQAEIDRLKSELASKIKHAGIGIGLFAVAVVVLFFALCTLIVAAILGLAVVLPGWAAALIVFGALVIVAGVLVALGIASFKKINGVAPQETISSVTSDINAVRGMGNYDR